MLDDNYIKEMVAERTKKVMEIENEYLEKIYSYIQEKYIKSLPHKVGDKLVELADFSIFKISDIYPKQMGTNWFEVSINLKSKKWSCWTNEKDILTDFVSYKDFKNKTPVYIKALEEYRKKNK